MRPVYPPPIFADEFYGDLEDVLDELERWLMEFDLDDPGNHLLDDIEDIARSVNVEHLSQGDEEGGRAGLNAQCLKVCRSEIFVFRHMDNLQAWPEVIHTDLSKSQVVTLRYYRLSQYDSKVIFLGTGVLADAIPDGFYAVTDMFLGFGGSWRIDRYLTRENYAGFSNFVAQYQGNKNMRETGQAFAFFAEPVRFDSQSPSILVE